MVKGIFIILLLTLCSCGGSNSISGDECVKCTTPSALSQCESNDWIEACIVDRHPDTGVDIIEVRGSCNELITEFGSRTEDFESFIEWNERRGNICERF